MNIKTAIYNRILEPKYIKVYQYIEELSKSSRMLIIKANKEDIVFLLADIISIKEKYNIPYSEDLILIEKYKK
jgi:hypothetical protein